MKPYRVEGAHQVFEWDESLGEPFVVVDANGFDQIGDAMSKSDAEKIVKEWNEREEQTNISGMGLSGKNGSPDLISNDGQMVDIKITNPYANLPPIQWYNPFVPKKRNTNKTPPKKKRKKK
jgi:hypothetical protein